MALVEAREKTVVDSARTRVSIRKYDSRPISREEITSIVELAGKAPSAFNVQPWRFIGISDPATRAKLQEAAFGQPQVGEAPGLLVLTSDMKAALADLDSTVHPDMPQDRREKVKETVRGSFAAMTEDEQRAWGRNQSNIALGYLLLVLESLGYGSSPMLGFDPAAVRDILALEEHVEIPAIVAFGYPAESGFPQHRLPVERVLRFVA